MKRQRVLQLPRARRFDIQAEVLLDTETFHLVDPFTYGIPQELEGEIRVGSKVRVPFRNSIVDGYVLSINSRPALSVKPILELRDCIPIPQALMATAKDVAARYATRLTDVLRFVPEVTTADSAREGKGKGEIWFRQANSDLYNAALDEVSEAGRTLFIAPTEREIEFLGIIAEKRVDRPIVRLSSSGGQRMRRASLSALAKEPNAVAIGARGSIFLPLLFEKVVVVGELSSHYWEQRAPYWNLRDVALLRQHQSGSNLTFVAPAPSLEMQRLIEIGFVRFQSATRAKSTRKYAFYPEAFHQTIRNGLRRGLVLVSVAEKTYSNLFSCDRCRSLPKCKCGGRLSMDSERTSSCSLCGQDQSEWACTECGSNQRRLIKKGALRIGNELGKAFPNTAIHVASGSQPARTGISNGIMVATPGAEPLGVPVAALVLLDGEALIARSGLRGEELLRNHCLRLLSATTQDAGIYVSLLANHAISQVLISGNLKPSMRNDLDERTLLELPPAKRIVVIEGEERDLLSLAKELRAEIPTLVISAPLKRNATKTHLNIRFDHDHARDLATLLYTLQRYRASTKRTLFTIRFDPLVI